MSEEQQPKTDEILSRTGQPLVRVRSKRKGNVENFTKNKRPPPAPPAEDPPPPDLEAPAAPDPEYVAPAEARGAETDDDEVPSAHPHPAWRASPTVGPIGLTDDGVDLLSHPPPPAYQPPDGSDGTLRTLDDLMGTFPIGDGTGQYFIHVERKKPPVWGGLATKGILRKIRRRLTIEDFKEEYGGGEYELIAYGPPRRPQVYDATGTPRPKALTKPIRLIVPYHGEGGVPPNPEATHDEEPSDENEETMRDNQQPFAGVPERLLSRGITPAGAKVVESGLQHQERMGRLEREDRLREEQKVQAATNETVQLLLQQIREQKQDSERTIRELKAELSRQQNTPSVDFNGLGNLMSSMNPRASGSEIEQLRDGHRRELESVNALHKQELDTLNRRHSDEIARHSSSHKDELSRAQQRAEQAEQRAAERVREVEAKFAGLEQRAREDVERVRNELKSDHQRQVDHIEKEAARTAATQQQMFENRIQSEQRSHDREVQTKDAIWESKLASEKARLEAEIRQLKAEASRRERDVEEFKQKAEKNKDLGAAMDNLRRQAEAIGMVPASEAEGGETDWKSIIAGVAMEAAKNLPDIMKGLGDSVAAVRGMKQGAPAQPAMGQAPVMRQQLPMPAPYGYRPAMVQGFASEDSGVSPAGAPNFPDYPQAQGVRPMPMAGPAPQPVTEMPQAQVAQQAPATEMPATPVLPAAPQGQPAAQAAASPASAPPAASDPQFDQMVLGGRESLEKALGDGTEPILIAKYIIGQYGPAMVQQHLPTMRAAAMRDVLTRHSISSPLLSRTGQKFLKAIEAAIVAELGTQGAVASP